MTMPNIAEEISVIIVNYCSRQFLVPCLSSVCRFFGALPEIIIINNDPAASLHNIVQSFPSIRIIQNKENLGFGAACNQGASAAHGKHLFFLNPDTVIQKGNLQKVSEMLEDKDIGAISPRLLDEKGQSQPWSCGRRITLWRILKNNLGLIGDQRALWNTRVNKEVDWISGSAFLIARDFFLELGGFNEHFFMYYEDIDLCQRIRAQNKKLVYFFQTTVVHRSGGSYANRVVQKKHYYRSQRLYFQKHRPLFEQMLLALVGKLFIKHF